MPATPPPPYRDRRARPRRSDGGDVELDVDNDERTPLLAAHNPRLRPRTVSHSTVLSTTSTGTSIAHTVLTFLCPDDDDTDGGNSALSPADRAHLQTGYLPCPPPKPANRFLSRRAWARYFRPLFRKTYYAALFHLLVINFPYALIAWIYLFVFTLTGTTLLVALPLGSVLCFLDLLGARAFARGELVLQKTFHGLQPDLPPLPFFARVLVHDPSDAEAGSGLENGVEDRQSGEQHAERQHDATGEEGGARYDKSFYRNTYAMFTDPSSYHALFYFLVVKSAITLLLTAFLLIIVPCGFALVLPAPLVLRFVRWVGAWQASVAFEGLYLAR